MKWLMIIVVVLYPDEPDRHYAIEMVSKEACQAEVQKTIDVAMTLPNAKYATGFCTDKFKVVNPPGATKA